MKRGYNGWGPNISGERRIVMSRLKVSLEEICQLERRIQLTIPSAFMDENQHMNVQYYLHVVERGIGDLYRHVGMGDMYARADVHGNFALEQHIRYFAEVLEGDLVSVYVRLLDLSPKRTYMMGFLVNDSREKLAASVELIAMNVDIRLRRGAPFPPAVYAKLERLLLEHDGLPWEAPTCGVMSA